MRRQESGRSLRRQESGGRNCECEGRNPEDPYAVALWKDGIIVGHIPRTISLFLRRGGAIQCTVAGPRKYSDDLLQGGLELPCTY